MEFSLTLRDGRCWTFRASDARGAGVLARLASICDLEPHGCRQGTLVRVGSETGIPEAKIRQALTVSSLAVLGAVVDAPEGP